MKMRDGVVISLLNAAFYSHSCALMKNRIGNQLEQVWTLLDKRKELFEETKSASLKIVYFVIKTEMKLVN